MPTGKVGAHADRLAARLPALITLIAVICWLVML
jgi:hypothetical protein